MPFRLMGQFEALTSDDLNFLQEVYDEAVASIDAVDDAAIRQAVGSLLAHYRIGITDKAQLVEIAAGELRRAAG